MSRIGTVDLRERYRRALDLFLEVYELSSEERAAALDRVAGPTDPLRIEVEELLRSHDRMAWRGSRYELR
jgi:hypothetical protein